MTVQHIYNPSSGGYNCNGSTLHSIRGKLALTAAGVSDTHIGSFTDSTFGGFNGAAYVYDTNPLRSMARQLATKLGITWQQGIQYPGAEGGVVHIVDNWAYTGAFTVAASLLFCNGVGTAIRTPLPGETGTAVSLLYSDLGTNGVPWKINGVAQTALATSGTNTIRMANVTGLTVGAQTIEIDCTASHNVTITGTRVYTPATKALHIHNMSVGGSRANGGTGSAIANNLNWASISSSPAYGLGWIMPNTLAAAGISLDFLLVSAGGNDANQAATVASTMTGLDGMFGYYPSVPGMLINAHKVSTVTDVVQNQFSAGKYQHTDSLNKSMFNWDDWVGGLAGAAADGLIGADGTHPNSAMQVEIGKQIANLIAG